MSDKPASPARGRKKTAPPAQQPPQEEVVVRLPLTDLYPFPDHPFQVRDDEEMKETIQSVKEYGVIVPAIVRPREEGGYEIVAGHRRKYACEQAGLDTMPVLIRNLDRDAATIIMVDSNLQRENILPSERAKAYKMKLEATRTLELWLLEDMSLAVVSCVSVNYDHDGYITQYRTIKDTPVMDSELCLDLGELVEDLNGLCGPVYEHTQPVYEP